MRFSVSTISITVTDSNDNSPVFINAPYSTTMPEGFIQSRQQVLVLNATDADSGTNGEITYSIAGGESGNFEIDSMTVRNIITYSHVHSMSKSIMREGFLLPEKPLKIHRYIYNLFQ